MSFRKAAKKKAASTSYLDILVLSPNLHICASPGCAPDFNAVPSSFLNLVQLGERGKGNINVTEGRSNIWYMFLIHSEREPRLTCHQKPACAI